jgi:hypothetical protein
MKRVKQGDFIRFHAKFGYFIRFFLGPLYTFHCIFGLAFPAIVALSVSDQLEKRQHAAVVWEGDSREVLHSFPGGVRQNLGFQLWQLQQGERPDPRPAQLRKKEPGDAPEGLRDSAAAARNSEGALGKGEET